MLMGRTLADAAAENLPEMRRQAESLHVETCDIERETTRWDEEAQESVTTWAPVHMSVPCALDVPPMSSRQLVTDQAATPEQPVVKVSHTLAATIRPDDRVTIVGFGVAWVTHVPRRSHQVQCRLICRWLR